MAKSSGGTATRSRARGADDQREWTDEEIHAWLDTQGHDAVADIRPPEGRAPRGMGQEYADRRWIANTIQAVGNNADRLEATLADYRGQKNRMWQMTRYRERLAHLRELRSQMLEIARWDADWWFKREIIADMKDLKKIL